MAAIKYQDPQKEEEERRKKAANATVKVPKPAAASSSLKPLATPVKPVVSKVQLPAAPAAPKGPAIQSYKPAAKAPAAQAKAQQVKKPAAPSVPAIVPAQYRSPAPLKPRAQAAPIAGKVAPFARVGGNGPDLTEVVEAFKNGQGPRQMPDLMKAVESARQAQAKTRPIDLLGALLGASKQEAPQLPTADILPKYQETIRRMPDIVANGFTGASTSGFEGAVNGFSGYSNLALASALESMANHGAEGVPWAQPIRENLLSVAASAREQAEYDLERKSAPALAAQKKLESMGLNDAEQFLADAAGTTGSVLTNAWMGNLPASAGALAPLWGASGGSGAIGQYSGLMPLFFGASGGKAQEALAQGYGMDKAAARGLASGTLEAAVELASGGAMGMGKGIASEPIKRFLGLGGGRIVDMLGEGVEEMASEAINPLLDRLMLDPNAHLASLGQVLRAGALGALGSFITGGGADKLTGLDAEDVSAAQVAPAEASAQGAGVSESQNAQVQAAAAAAPINPAAIATVDPNRTTIAQQISGAASELAGMKPVASVDFSIDRNIGIRENGLKAISHVLKDGAAVSREGFGEVELSERRLKDGLRYLKTPEDAAAILAIPSVIKNGKPISEHDDHKARGFQTFTFAAPVSVNGETGNMAVVVKQTNKNHYKTHRIIFPGGETIELDGSNAKNARDEVRANIAAPQDATSSPIHPVSGSTLAYAEQAVNNTSEENAAAQRRSTVKADREINRRRNEFLVRAENALDIPEAKARQARELVNAYINTLLENGGQTNAQQDEALFREMYSMADLDGIGQSAGHEAIARRGFDEALAEFHREIAVAVRYNESRHEKVSDKAAVLREDAPTRQEIDGAWKRVQELRERLRVLKEESLLTESDREEARNIARAIDSYEKGNKQAFDTPRIRELGLNPNMKTIWELGRTMHALEAARKPILALQSALQQERQLRADEIMEFADEFNDMWRPDMWTEDVRRVFEHIMGKYSRANDLVQEELETQHGRERQRLGFKDKYIRRVNAMKLSKEESFAVQFVGETLDKIGRREQQLMEISLKKLEVGRGQPKNAVQLNEEISGLKAELEEYRAQNQGMDWAKIGRSIVKFREIYDELFRAVNDYLLDVGEEPIPYRQGYFPHFMDAEPDTVLKAFADKLGLNVQELPTAIAGQTAGRRPNRPYMPERMARQGEATVYDAVRGFETALEHYANTIYRTDAIKFFRTLDDTLREKYMPDEKIKRIREIRDSPELSQLEKEYYIGAIRQEGNDKTKNSGLATFLTEYTNRLAGKQSVFARSSEGFFGRKPLGVFGKWNARFGASAVGGNIASAVTNLIPTLQAMNETNPVLYAQSMAKAIASLRLEDGGDFARSNYLRVREGETQLNEARGSSRRAGQVAGNVMNFMFETMDTVASRAVWYMMEQQALNDGYDPETAVEIADDKSGKIQAQRDIVYLPIAASRGGPMYRAAMAFQLEVRNQWSHIIRDIPDEIKERGLAWALKWFIQTMIAGWLYNDASEKVMGRTNVMIDPIGMANRIAGRLTGTRLNNAFDILSGSGLTKQVNQQNVPAALMATAREIGEQIPYLSNVSGLWGGEGRIPITGMLPDLTKLAGTIGADGNYVRQVLLEEGTKPLFGMIPGGGQLRKTAFGALAEAQGGRYRSDKEGKHTLQFPLEQTPSEIAQGLLFGQWAPQPARDYIDGTQGALNAAQTEAYDSLTAAGHDRLGAFDLINGIRNIKGKGEDEKGQAERRRNALLETGSTAPRASENKVGTLLARALKLPEPAASEAGKQTLTSAEKTMIDRATISPTAKSDRDYTSGSTLGISMLDDGQRARAAEAKRAGISSETYWKAYSGFAALTKTKPEGETATNAEKAQWLLKSDIPQNQKAQLWNIMNKTKEKDAKPLDFSSADNLAWSLKWDRDEVETRNASFDYTKQVAPWMTKQKYISTYNVATADGAKDKNTRMANLMRVGYSLQDANTLYNRMFASKDQIPNAQGWTRAQYKRAGDAFGPKMNEETFGGIFADVSRYQTANDKYNRLRQILGDNKSAKTFYEKVFKVTTAPAGWTESMYKAAAKKKEVKGITMQQFDQIFRAVAYRGTQAQLNALADIGLSYDQAVALLEVINNDKWLGEKLALA
ncbi:MAG: hypothetical protein LBD02_10800 [Christensenellaceae bacterium]|nr:hypothetical protein [Christensenellaceae bacterium]